ncbi:oligopeptide:H+ symporter [Stenotrophomonas maltophilia]|uniref:peptide MFS transporter n=1 Tax=Stenotrophomonas maltophilia TaxID=40324 RepID=UPI002ACCEDBA|nr:oligopeptide:H+ symporter [Stenotrophomonas maltophilia]MDZ5791486.1 oligopeptide:H+ symporter [Stenotrophomonas maltophilia]
MSVNATANTPEPALPDFKTTLGHPRPLWMLFMTEFWERFAFYGIRWALVLYIVAQFYNGSAAGEGDASRIYGAYLALVYAAAIFGGYVADRVLGYQRSILTGAMPSYKVVFIASGVGMLISLVWFYIGRAGLKGIGAPPAGAEGFGRIIMVLAGAVVAIPVAYFLLATGATALAWILGAMFTALAVLLLVEGIREGKVQRDRVIAMLIIFAFNVMFWMFFEQAGSSFTFLAENIVNRQFGDWTFPTAWFQSVNSVAIITLAPVIAWIWVAMGRANPSIPRKFGLGLLFNGAAFALLMFALSQMVVDGKIPFWTLFMVYVIQSVGELCLSPIGLSMVTKLAPVRLVGFGMGGWFLSTGIGNNLSGIFAGVVSGEGGMTVESALKGYTFGFWALIGSGVVLFLIAPLINKLMHGVK